MNDLGGQLGSRKMQLAESEPRVDLSMGRKTIEIPKENEGFQRSWGGVQDRSSQNLSLAWPSVWRGKSLKFLGKMKDSRSPGG